MEDSYNDNDFIMRQFRESRISKESAEKVKSKNPSIFKTKFSVDSIDMNSDDELGAKSP